MDRRTLETGNGGCRLSRLISDIKDIRHDAARRKRTKRELLGSEWVVARQLVRMASGDFRFASALPESERSLDGGVILR